MSASNKVRAAHEHLGKLVAVAAGDAKRLLGQMQLLP